jgi:hypothetical protein
MGPTSFKASFVQIVGSMPFRVYRHQEKKQNFGMCMSVSLFASGADLPFAGIFIKLRTAGHSELSPRMR